MGDFASLLSGLEATPGGDATTIALPDIVPQTITPQVITPPNAASPILMPQAVVTPPLDAPQVMPVSSILLQAQLPAVARQAAAALPDVLPVNQNVLPQQIGASDAVSEAPQTEVISPDTSPVPQPQTKPAKPATPPVAQAEIKMPAAVMVAASPETVASLVVPAVTATGKPEKDLKSGETTVTDDEAGSRAADTPSAASDMAVPLVASANVPTSVPASQPLAAVPDEHGAPAPVSNQTPGQPVAPQAPVGKDQVAQDQPASNNAQSDLPASEEQALAAPKFASLLNAAAPPRQETPAAVAGARIESDTPQVKSGMPATQTAQPVQTAPVQAPSLPQNQAAGRKVVTVSGEGAAEIVNPPVAAAPSGFSLVSTAVTSDVGGYAPAAPTPQTPATSLLSQTAVDNINALSVQINKRNAEGATKFTMELHPADLGKVEVALSIGRDGKMMAHMTFDNDMTAAAFSARESDLRQQLSATGLKLSDDALSFSTRLKTDAVAQAQSQSVNANARSADDPSSGNSSQQQQNAFTQADSQQGQPRSHSQHLAQMASRQAAADQAAADADLDALNHAIDASANRLKYRQSSSRLALDLSV